MSSFKGEPTWQPALARPNWKRTFPTHAATTASHNTHKPNVYKDLNPNPNTSPIPSHHPIRKLTRSPNYINNNLDRSNRAGGDASTVSKRTRNQKKLIANSQCTICLRNNTWEKELHKECKNGSEGERNKYRNKLAELRHRTPMPVPRCQNTHA